MTWDRECIHGVYSGNECRECDEYEARQLDKRRKLLRKKLEKAQERLFKLAAEITEMRNEIWGSGGRY